MEVKEYYNFKDILKFLNFDYEFEDIEGFPRHREFPFNMNKDEVEFSWGQVLIPKYGIREMVQNKISDIEDKPLRELKMMYQIPFSTSKGIGVINKNISLSFDYAHAYKYGEITKSIYECCFWILEHAVKTNDFYIIKGEYVMEFFSYCVINNQWGLGSMDICSTPSAKL